MSDNPYGELGELSAAGVGFTADVVTADWRGHPEPGPTGEVATVAADGSGVVLIRGASRKMRDVAIAFQDGEPTVGTVTLDDARTARSDDQPLGARRRAQARIECAMPDTVLADVLSCRALAADPHLGSSDGVPFDLYVIADDIRVWGNESAHAVRLRSSGPSVGYSVNGTAASAEGVITWISERYNTWTRRRYFALRFGDIPITWLVPADGVGISHGSAVKVEGTLQVARRTDGRQRLMDDARAQAEQRVPVVEKAVSWSPEPGFSWELRVGGMPDDDPKSRTWSVTALGTTGATVSLLSPCHSPWASAMPRPLTELYEIVMMKWIAEGRDLFPGHSVDLVAQDGLLATIRSMLLVESAAPGDVTRLRVLLLTAEETEVRRRWGPIRVLNALAMAHRVYPYPEVLDPGRSSTVTMEQIESSVLNGSPILQAPSSHVTTYDDLTVAAVPPVVADLVIESLRDGQILALLTGRHPGINAVWLWQPGASERPSMARTGWDTSDGISATFLVLAAGGADTINYVEDGVAAMLGPASVDRFIADLTGKGVANLRVGARQVAMQVEQAPGGSLMTRPERLVAPDLD